MSHGGTQVTSFSGQLKTEIEHHEHVTFMFFLSNLCLKKMLNKSPGGQFLFPLSASGSSFSLQESKMKHLDNF